MKNDKNRKNGEKWQKQMRSFRTLYESHGTQKKSSEQLRSSSTGCGPQMVRPGTGKMQKRLPRFWNLDHRDGAVL